MYLIVLFKNKEKKKIIKKFKTLKRAEKFYESKLKSSSEILFHREFENGVKSSFELGIVSDSPVNIDKMFVKDEFGRQVRVQMETSGFEIVKIRPFFVEELILEYSTGKKYTMMGFIKKFLNKTGYKMVSKLNNKIIVQNDDSIDLFTLKNVYDADRLIDVLRDYCLNNKKSDCIFVKDTSTAQRKYLYEFLTEKGYPKDYLFRLSTTHLK
jgi:hypothetical protein